MLRGPLRRLAAWIAASARDENAGILLVAGFIAAHVVLWTLILIRLKAAQDVHFDVAEAYAWGQKFLLGYGKHPPLSGWVAGLWFMVFPAVDWATYALAMTTLGAGMMVCWLIAIEVVDRRRALFTVLMLALYPIFNFKGFKYNPDILQLLTLPLLVLAYLHAFERRTARSGVWLGLAAAAALMTKYWALTVIGAVGVAALIHPARLLFLRSPAPWVAIAVFAIAMTPHLWWLQQVHFAPLVYAGDVYASSSRAQTLGHAIGYLEHSLALLAIPVLLALLALAWKPRWWKPLLAMPLAPVRQWWRRGPNPGVRSAAAITIWTVQIVVAVGPPLGAVLFSVTMKTDWGIPLFFLMPLALVAIPALRVQGGALLRLGSIWLAITLAVLAASPWIAAQNMRRNSTEAFTYGAYSELARELTQAWRARFHSRWAVVAAATEIGDPMTFYSPDHPATFTPGEVWSSGLTSLDEARRNGFIGICPNAPVSPACESWMDANAANAERSTVSTRRFFQGMAGPSTSWKVYLTPPAK